MEWETDDEGRLIRFHTRFRSSTFSDIQHLEQQTGESKAKIIRKLVRASLNNIDLENSRNSTK